MKKLRKEVSASIKGRGGLFDAFDDMMKAAYNVTEIEYDYILTNMTDDEMEVFVLGPNPTFGERRKSIEIRNKYVEEYNKNKQD